jgi:hypothetical protein
MEAPPSRSDVDDRVALGSDTGLRPAPLALDPASQHQRRNEYRDQDDPPDHDVATSYTTA